MKKIIMSLILLSLLGVIQAVNEDFFGYISEEIPSLEFSLLDEVLTPNIIKDLDALFDQNNNDIKSDIPSENDMKVSEVNNVNHYENGLNSIDNLNDHQNVTTENIDNNLVGAVVVLSKSSSKKRKRQDESTSKSKKSKNDNLEKKYKCDYDGCGYASVQSWSLKIHKRTHSGEKPFKCDYDGCNYATIISGNLKRHKRTHDGEKPFKCDYDGCSYAAADSGNLKVHKRKHDGEKPFKCAHPGCSYAAAHSGALKKHKQRNHS